MVLKSQVPVLKRSHRVLEAIEIRMLAGAEILNLVQIKEF